MSKIYSKIIKNTILQIADRAMNTNIVSSYRQIKKIQEYSTNERKEWQNARLRQLIDYAYNNTKHYNQQFKQLGLLPENINSIEDLEKLPVLTKKTIRENLNNILSDCITSIPHIKSGTGGSSGDPLIYYQDRRSWSMCNANNIINWERVGYNYGDKFIALGSTSLYVNKKTLLKHKMYYYLKNKIALNGVNMSEKVCKNYINLIKKTKIRFIYGYASSIYILAKYALENNEKIKIGACFTTSEVLQDHFRRTIKNAFLCDILDCYGANDGGLNAFARYEGFYDVGYNCLVRIEKPDSNGIGPALLTDLFNFAMPLINYKIGDEIQIDETKNKDYPYNGQIINKVFGRTSDIIQLENGVTLTGPGFTILFKDLPVEHYCIKKSGINTIECSIVKLPGFTQYHEDIIRSTFKKQMGADTVFNIEYTIQIPQTKSGKRQYFKS
jgi:phenylacetate-CoA ligase